MKKLFLCALGAIIFAACGNNNNDDTNATASAPDHDALMDSISAIEQAVGEEGMLFSADTAEMMVNMYTRFVNHFPEDSLTPIYMMRTADIEINRGRLETGIAIFDSVIENYTPGGFEFYADCMLRKAEALDQDGEHGQEAIAAYGKFVEAFPNHPAAKDLEKRFKFSKMSQQELLDAVHQMEGGKK